jgi:hypothetical protein
MGIAFFVIRELRKDEDQKVEQSQDQRRKDELKDLFENREERTLMEEFDEDSFWLLVDNAATRSGSNYKNFMGVMKDLLSKKSPEDLLKIDNLLYRLITNGISYDLTAASSIIFKDSNYVEVLLNLFISKGEVFFKNAFNKPELIIGKNFNDVVDTTISSVIGELYYKKTNSFIPTLKESEEQVELKGEPWRDKDLPSRYPELWQAFA